MYLITATCQKIINVHSIDLLFRGGSHEANEVCNGGSVARTEYRAAIFYSMLSLGSFLLLQLNEQDVSESYEHIVMKFFGEVGCGTGISRLDFGGIVDFSWLLDHFPVFFSISR